MEMLHLAVPWWELVLRGSVVYLCLFVLLRIAGKRQVGQLTPFDLVLLLIISNAVQNAMVGPDNSLLGGLLVAVVLIAWNRILSFAAMRSRRVERLIDGRPEILVRHGRIFEEVLLKQGLTHEDLRAALRRAGCFELHQVELAILETNGAITVRQNDPKA
jgi:uncharacterized membrane protein YcaP (DUF421 family)